MTRVLMLVDLQNDFLAASRLDPPPGELVWRAAALLEGSREAGIPIMHTRTTISRARDERMPHWRAAGRWDCVEGSPGHDAPAALQPRDEPCFEKTFFSAFSNPQLGLALSDCGAEELILAGVHLHGCIRATALDAYERGLRISIAEDAVGSYEGLHAAVAKRWLAARCARFESVESLLGRIGAAPRRGGQASAPDRASEPRAAADAAAGAGDRWRSTRPERRAELLDRAAELLEARTEEFAELIAGEIGKPVWYGRLEVGRGAALLRTAARLPIPEPVETAEAEVRRVPLGVVAQITPWNNPLAVPIGKLAPALRLGNSVVWKPSPLASAVAEELLALFDGAGVPDGLVSLVHGGAETAERLIDAAPVSAVSLTGSSAAGYAAQAICAERRIPLQAELGGNNAAVVWRDCDLGAAAEAIAEAGFGCAGQRCTANRRVIVDAACCTEFVERLEAVTTALELGDPGDPAVRVGPLVTEAARDRVAAAVERAGDHAEVRRPGAGRDRLRGLAAPARYLEPALVLCPDPDSEIVQHESFGPVVVVQRASDFDHALALVNGVGEGLVAALFSSSGALQRRFLASARVGVLKLNRATADVGVESPFGGWGRSGVGPPEHGDGNRDFYTRAQAIYS